MASVPETSLSLIAAAPPTSTTTKALIAVCAFAMAACGMHYASPLCLTHVLVAAIAAAEKTYLEAVESGILKSDVDMATMLTRCGRLDPPAFDFIDPERRLQLTVSTIREGCLRNSLSYRAALCGFVKGDTLTVLQCLHEVRAFEARIEILKEGRLRASDATSESAARVVSLRQRQTTNRV
ncbi:hypothetical protein FB451DRAFT_1501205 [Mycena latifolia]|nr:hypothetical protein FB451DRAFT_1501205 [Mycena latifolia]